MMKKLLLWKFRTIRLKNHRIIHGELYIYVFCVLRTEEAGEIESHALLQWRSLTLHKFRHVDIALHACVPFRVINLRNWYNHLYKTFWPDRLSKIMIHRYVIVSEDEMNFSTGLLKATKRRRNVLQIRQRGGEDDDDDDDDDDSTCKRASTTSRHRTCVYTYWTYSYNFVVHTL